MTTSASANCSTAPRFNPALAESKICAPQEKGVVLFMQNAIGQIG